MARQLKLVKSTEKVTADQDNLEQIDLRLNRQVRLCLQTQQSYNQKKDLFQFSLNFLQKLKKEHSSIKKGFLSEKVNFFAEGETKWKRLLKISMQQYSKVLQLKRDEKTTQPTICNQSDHLKYILDVNKVQNQLQQIKNLQQYKQDLYTKISAELRQEFLSDKIISRIRRQSIGAAKRKLKQHLQKQIQANFLWTKQTKDHVNKSIQAKLLEEKMVHNLSLMKLVMNKKIITNDQIFEKFAKGSDLERILLRVGQLATSINKRYLDTFQDLQVKYSDRDQQTNKRKIGNNKEEAQKQHLPFRQQAIEDYFFGVTEFLTNLEIYKPRQQLSIQYLKISCKINQLSASFKK